MSPVGHPQALGSHTYRKLISVSVPQLPHTVIPSFYCHSSPGPWSRNRIFFIPSPALPKLSRLPDLIYFCSVPQIHPPFSPSCRWLVLSLLLITNFKHKFFPRNLLSLFFQVVVCSWYATLTHRRILGWLPFLCMHQGWKSWCSYKQSLNCFLMALLLQIESLALVSLLRDG